jgi:phosphoglycerol transferase MdoB-like AlkP superfamily enzyme
MLVKYRIPKTIIWVVKLFLIFVILFTIYRLATYFVLRQWFRTYDINLIDLFPAFLMGLRYDIRWISILLLPIVLISMERKWSPFHSPFNKKAWTWYLAIGTFLVFFFFAAGFVNIDYNIEPLDAGAMNFAEDPSISFKMIVESYPLFWIIGGLVAAVLFFRWMYRRNHWQVVTKTDGKGIPYRRKFFIVAAVILVIFIWGNFWGMPLTRKDSFRFKNKYMSYLAINPMQNFFSTLKERKPNFSKEKAKAVFPLMKQWMKLPISDTAFSYKRFFNGADSVGRSTPNIVLVQLESFSMYKSSMSGNPLNTTPYLKSLCESGIFFDRCFTPHFSTARALFAILTGIPDAQLFKFSSRIPEALDQHTIVNDFKGYEKLYFLGGSPSFNNFEGILKNINGLQMHTEGSFSEQPINVWGISDKDLYLEANKVFKKQTKPFFAYIQTAGNHHPYDKSIAPEDTDFVKMDKDNEELKKYGFRNEAEFNAFRYSDYCIQKFMEAAKKESYFANTIFVFVGDHGVAGNATEMYPEVWTQQSLTNEHVPLLFYSPGFLKPEKREEVVSQIDILPTISGLAQISYTNTTLGRDLLDTSKKNDFAFITSTTGTIGMVTDSFYFVRNINFPDEQLFTMRNDIKLTQEQSDSIKKALSAFTSAYFETAKYLIMNNKKAQ